MYVTLVEVIMKEVYSGLIYQLELWALMKAFSHDFSLFFCGSLSIFQYYVSFEHTPDKGQSRERI